ncbi:conjugal transfer protein TraD [Legionella jordanis]|nr:conjugal transfer protein TraD [Legionella jordanis]
MNTRGNIEWGGLVIKSGMNRFNKATILGALDFSYKLI